MEIGERIKEIRTSKGMTQKEMSDKLGIPQSTLSKYENGKLRIDADMINELSLVLGVMPADILLGHEEERKKIVISLAATLDQLKQLGEKGSAIHNLFNQYGYMVSVEDMILNKEAIEEDFRRYIDYIYHSYFSIPKLDFKLKDKPIANLDEIIPPKKDDE